MNKILASLLVVCTLSLVLAACASLKVEGTPRPTPSSPAPCVTATPAPRSGASAGQGMATPAGQTTPSSGSAGLQPTVSAAELETREAQLSQQNRPMELPTAEQSNSPTLPVCPTPTPTP